MTIKKIMLFNQANENGFLSVGINVKYHPMPLIAVENMMWCNAASLYRVSAISKCVQVFCNAYLGS